MNQKVLERKVFSLKIQLECMSEQIKRDREMHIDLAKRLHKAETELYNVNVLNDTKYVKAEMENENG